jgi:hypothetical protein
MEYRIKSCSQTRSDRPQGGYSHGHAAMLSILKGKGGLRETSQFARQQCRQLRRELAHLIAMVALHAWLQYSTSYLIGSI